MTKRGRKQTLEVTDETLEKIEKMSGVGLTQLQIASYYGITPQCWHKTKKRDKRLDVAVKKGKSQAIVMVAGKLMQKINEGNLSAIIFYLKTQGRWSENSTVELKDNVKSKHQIYKIDTTDDIEASKIYQSIMTGSYKDERNSSSK